MFVSIVLWIHLTSVQVSFVNFMMVIEARHLH
jgi:hypothetical protein